MRIKSSRLIKLSCYGNIHSVNVNNAVNVSSKANEKLPDFRSVFEINFFRNEESLCPLLLSGSKQFTNSTVPESVDDGAK